MKLLNGTVIFFCMIILFFYSESAFTQECNPSGIPASTSFKDNGNGTATDLKTGLMWKKQHEEGKFTWQQALKMAEEVNSNGGFAGYSDWRVPNIRELKSILEVQCYDPSINIAMFPDADSSDHYWSSSPVAYSGSSAWTVGFLAAGGDFCYPKSYSFSVRLVRGGQ